MKYTTSTHVGHTVSIKHNIRDRNAIKNQHHIDRNRTPENRILKHIPIENFYKEFFKEAMDEYNQGKRKSRQITDYYQKIKKDKQQHPVYEMIVQIGDKNNYPCNAKEILTEFYKTFEEKNPNMKVIGAYLHMDEATPHMHIDYVPVAFIKEKNGMSTRVSLKGACHEMGYQETQVREHNEEGKLIRKFKNPHEMWIEKQRKNLDELCKEKGLEIYHPIMEGIEEKRKHVDTKEYKIQQHEKELVEKEEALNKAEDHLEQRKKALNDSNSEINKEIEKKVEETITRKLEPYKRKIDVLEAKISSIEESMSQTFSAIETHAMNLVNAIKKDPPDYTTALINAMKITEKCSKEIKMTGDLLKEKLEINKLKKSLENKINDISEEFDFEY